MTIADNAPKASAVIVNWNRNIFIQKTIQSLIDQQYPDLEIIVVDNGSTDESLPWLRERPFIRLIENKKNVGAAAARNQGTKIASGDYIIYIDSDAEMTRPGDLSRLIDYLDKHPDTAGAAGLIYNDEQLTNLWCWTPCMDWEGNHDPVASLQPTDTPLVLSTCFSVYRRGVLQEVGGFDEYYFYLYEDGDLSERLRKQGYRLYVDTDIKIMHHYSPKGRTAYDSVSFHYYHEQLRINFVLKHWGIRRFFQSWKHKLKNLRDLKQRFPYLSWFNLIDMYGFRSLYYLFRYLAFVKYNHKKWI